MWRIFLFFCFTGIVISKHDGYSKYKVYSINLQNQLQQDRMDKLRHEEIQYLRQPSVKYQRTGWAIVPPKLTQWFEDRLRDLEVPVDIKINNLNSYLRTQKNSLINTMRTGSREFNYDGYYRYSEILEYLNVIQDLYNTTTASVEVIESGVTAENRPLVYVKLSRPSDDEKPVIIIEGGINPSEWITIPAAINVIERTLQLDRYLDDYDWIIIPVVNPDGYEYTHTNLRFWTKNLSTSSNLGLICPGVNINRNFDIDFGFSGSSSSACSHLYRGIDAFSEPESIMIRSLIEEYGNRLRLYISLQNTNGGYISYPWQYEFAASGMFRQHHLLGLEMVQAIKEGGRSDEYFVDVSSVSASERISGTSTDYVSDSGILYTFNIDIANGEFEEIAEEDIAVVVDDVWRAVAVAADHLIG